MLRFKFIIETIVSTLIYYSGFNWLYTKIMTNGRNIPITFYHEIGNKEMEGLVEYSVRIDHFDRQIQWLSRRFNVVPIDELIKHIKGEIKLAGKFTAITFDGGYVGNYKYAFPILKKYNVPASVYVVTDSVDGNIPWERKLLYLISLTGKKRFKLDCNQQQSFEIGTREQKRAAKLKIQTYMAELDNEGKEKLLAQLSEKLDVELSGLAQKLFLSWDQIREMNKSRLITIESHSLTHPRLTDISLDDVTREIIGSKKRIESELGEKITSFCYPDGRVSEEIKASVKNSGYSSGLAVKTPAILSDLNKIGDDVFELRRIYFPDRFYTPLIATEISGIMRILKNMGKLLFAKVA